MTTIRVKYGETVSTGDYSNVRVDVEYEQQTGNDPNTWFPEAVEEMKNELLSSAKKAVHDEIDEALEKRGLPPRYFEGPKYRVAVSHVHECVCIFPNEILPPGFMSGSYNSQGIRLPIAKKKAEELAGDSGYPLFDLSEHPDDVPYPWEEPEEPEEPEEDSASIAGRLSIRRFS